MTETSDAHQQRTPPGLQRAAHPRGRGDGQALRPGRRPARRRPAAVPRRGARRDRRQRRRQVHADQVPVRRDDPRPRHHQGRAASRSASSRPRRRGRPGIETVYQTLAVAPALDIASNLYLAREIRRPGFAGSVLRMLDTKAMRDHASEHIKSLGISTLQNINQSVETLSGGQRQIVAVARTGAFGSKIAILDEPTAALGVRETAQVLRLVRDLRDQGLGVILISHNMPNVFETADRIHVQRLGGRAAVVSPETHSMQDAVAIMTGAMTVPEDEQTLR